MSKFDILKKEVCMKGYDFDKTIYDGDSFLEFFFFSMIYRPFFVLFLPAYGIIFLLYLCKVFSKKDIKEFCMFTLRFYKDKNALVQRFWNKHMHKIKPWYLAQKQFDDVIITASPEFLVGEACARLALRSLIGTRMNIETGKIEGKNCWGKEKVVRFKEQLGDIVLDSFYSDSLSDMPMMEQSSQGFLVKGSMIKKIYPKE